MDTKVKKIWQKYLNRVRSIKRKRLEVFKSAQVRIDSEQLKKTRELLQ